MDVSLLFYLKIYRFQLRFIGTSDLRIYAVTTRKESDRTFLENNDLCFVVT